MRLRTWLLAASLGSLLLFGLILSLRGKHSSSRLETSSEPPLSNNSAFPGLSLAGLNGSAAPIPGIRNNVPPPLSSEGKAALKRGRTALDQGKPNEAATFFQRAVKTDPRDPLTHDYLGVAYLQNGRLDQAMAQFRQVTQLDPDPSTGWARIADVYYARHNVKEAIRAVEKAIALRPDRAQLHYNLGMLYSQGLDMNKAIDSLERYCAMEPGNHYAHYMRGSLLYKLVRLDRAEEALKQAIQIAPNAGLYHFALGQVHFRRTATPEATERARAELQLALDDGGPKAETTYFLGLCDQRKGNWEAACKELQSAARMLPDGWGPYYALAKVLEKLGRTEEATAARARFVELRAKEDRRMKRAFYEQEVERNPDSAEIRYQLAAFLAKDGDRKAAVAAAAHARRLVDGAKEDPALVRRIALLSAELGRTTARE